jgi:hypothetical protein
MTFKKLEVHKFFTKKLKCEAHEGGRHTQYVLRLHGRKMPLPPLTVERASGDLSPRNLKGLANDLGLSQRGFDEGVRCPVRRACVLLCVVARFIGRVMEQCEREPIVHREAELSAARESAEVIFDELANNDGKPEQWKAVEQKELRRAQRSIEVAANHAPLQPVVDSWREWAQLDVEK